MSNLARVDQKGRLKIPVTLLSMLKKSGMELYVTSEDGPRFASNAHIKGGVD
jgi:DNA-binding transcriptional regulator/RsmH inhibitor MraZ